MTRARWPLAALPLLVACGGKPTIHAPDFGGAPALSSPLGPSYVLLPLAAEDDGLVGRILKRAPKPGEALEELTAANPCASELEPPVVSETAGSFEDAVELRAGVGARAVLGGFGFSGDAATASHFVYRIETQKRVTRRDKASYAECCKQKGCGYGYVSTLVFGKGEYAAAEEATGSVKVDFVAASGNGQVALKTLHRRAVRGGIAAVVTVAEGAKEPVNALGLPVSSGIEETTLSAAVKDVYEANKISVGTTWKDPQGKEHAYESFVFTDGSGHTLTENEFVRRYQSVTGAHDLDAFDRPRRTAFVVMGVGLVGLGAGGLWWTFSKPAEERKGNPIKGVLIPTFSGEAVVGGAALAIWALATSDGTVSHHDLSDREARLFVDRYNRVLLRTTVRGVQKNQSRGTEGEPTIAFFPLATPGVLGLGAGGRF